MRKIWRKVGVCVVVVFCYVILRASVEDLGEGVEHQPIPRAPVTPQPVYKDEISRLLAANTADCPSIGRPTDDAITYRNGYWQAYHDGDTHIYVFSAFYDDRPMAGMLPHVRVLGVSTMISRDLYCHVWYPNHVHPLILPVTVTTSGRGDKFSGIKYLQSLYSCQLPLARPLPSHVSISTAACRNSSLYMPIVVSPSGQINTSNTAHWQHEFGICVAIAFGAIPVKDFVEWMEFQRLMGVSEVNIYDGNLERTMDPVLEYYRRHEVLRVHSMPPPVMDFTMKGVKLSSPASLNDCMLRNMYRYRYMVVIDFDEFIVPSHHDNYTHMLQDIDKMHKLTQPVKSYTFRNAYYFQHFPQDMAQQLKTMRFRYHAAISKFLYAGKSFIDPKTCLSVFNHFCYKRFTKEKQFTVDVNWTIASNHHYRVCGFEKAKCEELTKHQILDDSILRFQNKLTDHVEQVLHNISSSDKYPRNTVQPKHLT